MLTGTTLSSITIKDIQYCDNGVIIAANSWDDLDAYLLQAKKNKKLSRIIRKIDKRK